MSRSFVTLPSHVVAFAAPEYCEQTAAVRLPIPKCTGLGSGHYLVLHVLACSFPVFFPSLPSEEISYCICPQAPHKQTREVCAAWLIVLHLVSPWPVRRSLLRNVDRSSTMMFSLAKNHVTFQQVGSLKLNLLGLSTSLVLNREVKSSQRFTVASIAREVVSALCYNARSLRATKTSTPIYPVGLRLMSRAYQPTAEDLAKAEQRRLKKEQAKKEAPAVDEDERGQILPRNWLDVSPHFASNDGHSTVTRIMTWNVSKTHRIVQRLVDKYYIQVLAQSLVRKCFGCS